MEALRSYAFYRLPGETEYTSVSSDTVALLPISDLFQAGRCGFAAVPFSDNICEQSPVFIPADEVSTGAVPDGDSVIPGGDGASSAADSGYVQEFELFHGAVRDGKFRKLVLARSMKVDLPDAAGKDSGIFLRECFFRACRTYPQMMVMLFFTPLTSAWLVASPEPLLEWKNGECHTVALAGTMNSKGRKCRWSEKNREEQKLVSDFILEAVSPLCGNVRREGPYTFNAGNVCHLRTDFFFRAEAFEVGPVAVRLHPTPAVCGLPQDAARKFIMERENLSREYYSGFAGPVGMECGIRLYVSLRCAKIAYDFRTATLYAGGGIMPRSRCRSEFMETENKMQTISKCIVTRKM